MGKFGGTEYMQEMNTHYMGIGNIKGVQLTPEQIEANNKKLEEEQLYTANALLEKNKGVKVSEKSHLVATGYTVIFKPYDKNPYRQIETTASGLILSGDLFADQYKSNETGEMEQANEMIACGQAISVGPECKYVKEGEDFYYRNSKVPVPFRTLGYYAISEQNIICRVLNE